MQFTPAQRRFFIDPVQDPTNTVSTKILVLEERTNRGIHLDKIVEVRKERYASDYRHWWTTEGGDHVYGAPINPPNIFGTQRLIAEGGDGWFWIGQPGRRSGPDSYVLSTARRSDGRKLPGAGNNVNELSLTVPAAVLAAPWADELFPAPGDSDTVVLAKLALAEQRWMHRRAKAEIMRQGMGRGWDDDLVTLREDGKLPAPNFGVYFRGQVMIDPTSTTITPSTRDEARLQEIRDRVPVVGDGVVRTLLGVSVNVPLPVNVDSFQEVRKLPHVTMQEHLRAAVGDYSAIAGDHTITPVLRSVSA